MEDLGMNQVSARFVQRLSTADLLQRANYDKNLLKNVITSDEMWVYGYDVETNQQYSQLEESRFALPQEIIRGVLASGSDAACFF
jgi:hypothetical protein